MSTFAQFVEAAKRLEELVNGDLLYHADTEAQKDAVQAKRVIRDFLGDVSKLDGKESFGELFTKMHALRESINREANEKKEALIQFEDFRKEIMCLKDQLKIELRINRILESRCVLLEEGKRLLADMAEEESRFYSLCKAPERITRAMMTSTGETV